MCEDQKPMGIQIAVTFGCEDEAYATHEELSEIGLIPLDVVVAAVPRIGETLMISGNVGEGEDVGKMVLVEVVNVFHALISDESGHHQSAIFVKCEGVPKESLLMMTGMLSQKENEE